MEISRSGLVSSVLLVVISGCAFEYDDGEAIDELPQASVLESADEAIDEDTPETNAGGGCQGWWWPDGFLVRPCISQSGTYAVGDAYIDALPSACDTIALSIWQRTGGWHQPVARTFHGCRTGRIGPIFVPMVIGSFYFTEVCHVHGRYTDCSRSPEVWR
jgi:hypothetical protein